MQGLLYDQSDQSKEIYQYLIDMQSMVPVYLDQNLIDKRKSDLALELINNFLKFINFFFKKQNPDNKPLTFNVNLYNNHSAIISNEETQVKQYLQHILLFITAYKKSKDKPLFLSQLNQKDKTVFSINIHTAIHYAIYNKVHNDDENLHNLSPFFLNADGQVDGNDGLSVLALTFMFNPSIVVLDLQNSNITDIGIKVLTEQLIENKNKAHLSALNLSGNVISVDSMKEITRLFRHFEMRTLSLGKCQITDDGLFTLIKGLKKYHIKLVDLDLQDNNLTHVGIEKLTTLSALIENLSYLNLSNNKIADEGIIKLTSLFMHTKALQHLSLCSCKITNQGIKIFINSLSQYKIKFNVLSLEDNEISDENIQRLLKVFLEDIKQDHSYRNDIDYFPSANEIKQENTTLLESLAICGDLSKIKELIEKDPECIKKDGAKSVYWAALHGHFNIIDSLMQDKEKLDFIKKIFEAFKNTTLESLSLERLILVYANLVNYCIKIENQQRIKEYTDELLSYEDTANNLLLNNLKQIKDTRLKHIHAKYQFLLAIFNFSIGQIHELKTGISKEAKIYYKNAFDWITSTIDIPNINDTANYKKDKHKKKILEYHLIYVNIVCKFFMVANNDDCFETLKKMEEKNKILNWIINSRFVCTNEDRETLAQIHGYIGQNYFNYGQRFIHDNEKTNQANAFKTAIQYFASAADLLSYQRTDLSIRIKRLMSENYCSQTSIITMLPFLHTCNYEQQIRIYKTAIIINIRAVEMLNQSTEAADRQAIATHAKLISRLYYLQTLEDNKNNPETSRQLTIECQKYFELGINELRNLDHKEAKKELADWLVELSTSANLKSQKINIIIANLLEIIKDLNNILLKEKNSQIEITLSNCHFNLAHCYREINDKDAFLMHLKTCVRTLAAISDCRFYVNNNVTNKIYQASRALISYYENTYQNLEERGDLIIDCLNNLFSGPENPNLVGGIQVMLTSLSKYLPSLEKFARSDLDFRKTNKPHLATKAALEYNPENESSIFSKNIDETKHSLTYKEEEEETQVPLQVHLKPKERIKKTKISQTLGNKTKTKTPIASPIEIIKKSPEVATNIKPQLPEERHQPEENPALLRQIQEQNEEAKRVKKEEKEKRIRQLQEEQKQYQDNNKIDNNNNSNESNTKLEEAPMKPQKPPSAPFSRNLEDEKIGFKIQNEQPKKIEAPLLSEKLEKVKIFYNVIETTDQNDSDYIIIYTGAITAIYSHLQGFSKINQNIFFQKYFQYIDDNRNNFVHQSYLFKSYADFKIYIEDLSTCKQLIKIYEDYGKFIVTYDSLSIKPFSINKTFNKNLDDDENFCLWLEDAKKLIKILKDNNEKLIQSLRESPLIFCLISGLIIRLYEREFSDYFKTKSKIINLENKKNLRDALAHQGDVTSKVPQHLLNSKNFFDVRGDLEYGYLSENLRQFAKLITNIIQSTYAKVTTDLPSNQAPNDFAPKKMNPNSSEFIPPHLRTPAVQVPQQTLPSESTQCTIQPNFK